MLDVFLFIRAQEGLDVPFIQWLVLEGPAPTWIHSTLGI